MRARLRRGWRALVGFVRGSLGLAMLPAEPAARRRALTEGGRRDVCC